MKNHKKVTYTLEKEIINIVEKRSALEKIPQSKLLSIYVQSGFEMLMEEYNEHNSELISKLPRKIFNTTPKTYTLPIDVEKILSWFSNKLLIKKSHLVKICIQNYELMEKEKEEQKISNQIDELIVLMEQSYCVV
ncbi:MAG: hypothetical protein U5K55_02980 [Aliarcobacter sp.]|nr:hypothetical protein [Aliarcobacter sp.]